MTPRSRAGDCTPSKPENLLSPPTHVQILTAAMWRIAYELHYLETVFVARNPGRNPHVEPSQQYLARKVGVTREWISRCTSVMHAHGFLCKTRRRPVRGRRLTCMYQLASAIGWRIRRFLNAISLRRNQVNNTGQKASTFLTSSLTPGAPRRQQGAAPP